MSNMENKNVMVGRHQELTLLQEIISSPKAELVVVYGRRRIGKTFLIDKTFDAKYDFYITGIYEGTRKEQLTNFANQLGIYAKKRHKVPKNWMSAFLMLREYIETLLDKKYHLLTALGRSSELSSEQEIVFPKNNLFLRDVDALPVYIDNYQPLNLRDYVGK